jgi:hypothetical protein
MPKRLYKFTKAEFALLALKDRRSKISTIDDLNDPSITTRATSAAARSPSRNCVWRCRSKLGRRKWGYTR